MSFILPSIATNALFTLSRLTQWRVFLTLPSSSFQYIGSTLKGVAYMSLSLRPNRRDRYIVCGLSSAFPIILNLNFFMTKNFSHCKVTTFRAGKKLFSVNFPLNFDFLPLCYRYTYKNLYTHKIAGTLRFLTIALRDELPIDKIGCESHPNHRKRDICEDAHAVCVAEHRPENL